MAIRQYTNNPGITLSGGPKLIVGLGNDGEKYSNTRHNAGFMALDLFAQHYDVGEFSKKKDLRAYVAETTLSGEKVILAKPTTMMNLSGQAIVALQNYYKVNDPDILIVYDDVDITFGTLRTRSGGSSGGHNGLKSIEQMIGDSFHRIRIGVKNQHLVHVDTADFVLDQFSRAEQADLKPILQATSEHMHNFIAGRFAETSQTVIGEETE